LNLSEKRANCRVRTTELAAKEGDRYNLSSEYIALQAASGRIWFANTSSRDRVYELRLVDVEKP
jgi:hypothetical protein